jgi:hypothetical protein
VIAATGVAATVAGVAAAAKPVSGTIAGPVTAVRGRTFTLKSSLSPTGNSNVHVAATTAITEQRDASRADLTRGACVSAVGQKGKKGVVQAVRLTLFAPVQGRCQPEFGGRRAGGPQGTPRPPTQPRPPQRSTSPGTRAGFSFAAGAIVTVDRSVLTVHNQQGSTKIAISSKTEIVKTARVGAGSIKVGLCAFVYGTSTDKGVDVSAQSVSLFKPAAQGCIARRR